MALEDQQQSPTPRESDTSFRRSREGWVGIENGCHCLMETPLRVAESAT